MRQRQKGQIAHIVVVNGQNVGYGLFIRVVQVHLMFEEVVADLHVQVRVVVSKVGEAGFDSEIVDSTDRVQGS